MKSLSGYEYLECGRRAVSLDSFQAWKYGGVSSIRPSSLSTHMQPRLFLIEYCKPVALYNSASVKCVGEVLLKPLKALDVALHQPCICIGHFCREDDGLLEQFPLVSYGGPDCLVAVDVQSRIHCDCPLGRLPQVTYGPAPKAMTKVIYRLPFSYKCIACVLR